MIARRTCHGPSFGRIVASTAGWAQDTRGRWAMQGHDGTDTTVRKRGARADLGLRRAARLRALVVAATPPGRARHAPAAGTHAPPAGRERHRRFRQAEDAR